MGDQDGLERPAAKRQRLENGSSLLPQTRGSRFFAPFRTVGLVSPTSVPFTSIPLGKTTFQITTSVGRSLQTYDLLKGLNLVFLSRPQTPQPITAIHAFRDRVFVAWGGSNADAGAGVWVLKRGRRIGELEAVDHPSIHTILSFGTWIIGCTHSTIQVWTAANSEHYTTITPPNPVGGSAAHALTGHACTIPTYLNKVFVGRTDGNVDVYNVRTGKLVHSILSPSLDCGAVSALTPTSALGLIAVAYNDGTLCIHDIDSGEISLRLKQPGAKRPITSIAFRSDGLGAGDDGRKDGTMATASIETGDITLWDLNEEGRVAGVLRGAHDISNTSRGSGVAKIEFLSNQPVLISSGLDNSLKSWIFDQTPFSPVPRPLHARSGHAAPVTALKFLPSASDGSEAAGKWLMSAGLDRSLWAFSLRRDGQSTEISQGNVKSKSKKVGHLLNEAPATDQLKVAPIIDIACSLNRDGGMGAIGGAMWSNPKMNNAEQANITGWESVVTTHEGDKFARTWSWGRKKAGRWVFETGDHSPATSVAVTSCGTFALVGSSTGSLDMFNLQSGIHRQRFPPRLKPAQSKSLATQDSEDVLGSYKGHRDAITGIVVDNLNQWVLSSSLDGTVRVWAFTTGKLLDRVLLNSAVPSALKYNPVSGLVSIPCDDSCIRILDLETRRTVRELWGCVGQIYDHCFSHDGRWIVSCSMDSVIRVFDLATGHLIDAFKTSTCTNITFSSTGEFLASSHAGELGIRIWTNKSLFSYIPTRQIHEPTDTIDLTSPDVFEGQTQLATLQNSAEDHLTDPLQIESPTTTIDQLDRALLTLSLVPQSRWQTLLNLEEIRKRNKPIQPPEKPKAAPFFLSSAILPTTNNNVSSINENPNNPQSSSIAKPPPSTVEKSRISTLTSFAHPNPSSTLTALLSTFAAQHPTPDPTPPLSQLSTLGPSAADLEIRSLTPAEIPVFVRCLTAQVRRRRDFELVNVWMSVLLGVHGEMLVDDHDDDDDSGGAGDGDDGDDGVGDGFQVFDRDDDRAGGEVGDGDGEGGDARKDFRRAVREFSDAVSGEADRLGDLVGYVAGVVGWLRSSR